MSTTWQAFVDRAIQGEPDDPFVRLLRQRVAAGYEIVRVNVITAPTGPAYLVLLTHLRQLSTLEVPHSSSFTRWSLAHGIRMASLEEEEQRCALIARERFQSIDDEFGVDHASDIFLERVRALSPPRTARLLAGQHALRAAPGKQQSRAAHAVDALLRTMTTDLGVALRYLAAEAADILDGALEIFGRARFPADVRKLSSVG